MPSVPVTASNTKRAIRRHDAVHRAFFAGNSSINVPTTAGAIEIQGSKPAKQIWQLQADEEGATDILQRVMGWAYLRTHGPWRTEQKGIVTMTSIWGITDRKVDGKATQLEIEQS